MDEPISAMLDVVNAREWLARRRLRRVMRRVYAVELRSLDTTFAWMATGHPEWPPKRTARQVIRQADAVLGLNRVLGARGFAELPQLTRDAAWIRQIRASAEGQAGTGDDGGSAGVREPRRPLPRAGGPGAVLRPPGDDEGPPA